MKFFILASLILLGFLIYRASRLQRKQSAHEEKTFWEREEEANSVRRKPLDGLEYITIPLDTLPVNVLSDNDVVTNCTQIITGLADQKIVNLTGYTNTDLKLAYGAANLTALTEYDDNYTLLARTLQEWADALHAAGLDTAAQSVLEFAIDTHTDVSRSYYLLAEIYAGNLDYSRIEALADAAASLRSSNAQTIVRTLQETYL
ncbi:MAG: hypothetical protein E7287_03815 [Lachnospiraceae bacterium]|nr:hypothetical protein [Lachnospiraceae bacterium]